MIIAHLVSIGKATVPGTIDIDKTVVHLRELRAQGIVPNGERAAELGAGLLIEMGGRRIQ